MGRPRTAPTEMQLERIKKLAAVGCTLEQIAIACDISETTLKRWRKDAQVDRAYQLGRIEAIEGMANQLYSLAMGGDVAACIFWLKAQAGWRDKPPEDAPVNAPQVVVYIPENQR